MSKLLEIKSLFFLFFFIYLLSLENTKDRTPCQREWAGQEVISLALANPAVQFVAAGFGSRPLNDFILQNCDGMDVSRNS
jgi:hypothetical protein